MGASQRLSLSFDHKEPPPADLVPATMALRSPSQYSFVQAAKPTDPASLKKAQEQGLLTMATAGWGPTSRGAADNEGAGGIPRQGFELAMVNRERLWGRLNRLIQQVIDYERRVGEVCVGNDPGTDIGRVTIILSASTVGGTGSGSLIWFLTECVSACARRNGVEPKIVLDLLSLGNLQTHDTQLARLNELITLRTLRAYGTGAYVHVLSGEVMPVPFDHIRLYGNINARGNQTSLKAFVSHQAHLRNFIWTTPAGGDLQEREPDMVNREHSALEDPMCVYTGATAAIHWNGGRLLAYCGLLGAGMFIESLLAEGDDERVLADATAMAAACNLIESEQQSQLTALISRPDELPGETVYARAEQSLTDRIAGTRGHDQAIALQETIQSILNSDIPSVFEPLMQGKAQSVVETVEESLARHLDQILRQPQGLWEAAKLLQLLLLVLERSQQAIAEKAGQLQEYLAAHEQVMAEAAEQLQQFAERNWLRRSAGFQLLGSINSTLAESGKAAINYRLQVAACTIANQSVLNPLSDLLERKLARLISARQRLAELAQHCRNKAQRRADAPNVFQVPVGIELVTPEYLSAWFREHVAHSGGHKGFIETLRSRFLESHESFAALVEASVQEMEQIFLRLCRCVFQPAVAGASVLTEFCKAYPEEQTRQRIVAELIGQSEGRLLVRGEVNKTVAWVKTANVPSADDAEWVAKLLENADRKAGKWQVAVNPADRQTFSIAQLRGELSLTPFIDELDLPDTCESWKRIIPAAADPVGAIIPDPNPSDRQFRRVLAKAIACGLLTVEGKGCLAFRDSLDQECLLGQDSAAVDEKLRVRWSQIVFAESFFASQLVDREDEITTRLEQMKADLTASDKASDKRLHLIDVAAIDECLQQIEWLRPWSRRIQKARRRTS